MFNVFEANSCLHGKEVLAISRAGLVSAVLEDRLEGVSWLTQSSFIPVVT